MSDRDDPRDDRLGGEAGPPGDGAEEESDDARVAEGVEHLPRAAREMIAAARSFLDVVEDVVGDHVAVSSVAEAFSSWGQAVSRAAGRMAEGDESDGEGEDPGQSSSRSQVQHIDLS